MPLQRLPALDPGTVRPPETSRPGGVGERAGNVTRPERGDARQPGLPPRPAAPAEDGLGDVPAGADARAWLGLSVEERAFFARLEAVGPLGYGPTHEHGEPVLHRGRHLHIRV